VSRFVRYAVNVMGVENDFTDPKATALRGVEATERFYHDIGMPTCMTELLGRTLTDEEIDVMADKASRGGTVTLGTMMVLDVADMKQIYNLSNH
jgi:alcohol dehydrogenase YqhD (iron-dependent ADH family)